MEDVPHLDTTIRSWHYDLTCTLAGIRSQTGTVFRGESALGHGETTRLKSSSEYTHLIQQKFWAHWLRICYSRPRYWSGCCAQPKTLNHLALILVDDNYNTPAVLIIISKWQHQKLFLFKMLYKNLKNQVILMYELKNRD